MDKSTELFYSYNLYSGSEKFYLEPRDREGKRQSPLYLEIDRHSNEMKVLDTTINPMPTDGEVLFIHGFLGTIQLVSGLALVVIKEIEKASVVNGHQIWTIRKTEVIPFKKTTLHLTEKQIWYNRHFTEMIYLVLATGGFYFSHSLDISRSIQWLSENGSPNFSRKSMIERADIRFVWNKHLLSLLRQVEGADRFCLPLIHGFIGQVEQRLNNQLFKLTLISRRSVLRAGVRFYKRGVGPDGNSANFVETEQIVETGYDGHGGDRRLTSFVQLRGSIPLFWSQKPNLKWQPLPTLRSDKDQLIGFLNHFNIQKINYGGNHVIVDLVNRSGRERRVGGELERIASAANMDFVRYHPFDFHKECHSMRWERISLLKDQLTEEIQRFGFFASSLTDEEFSRSQTGFFRTNCMDCLDRTNVVQAMIARESLTAQLQLLGILHSGVRVENVEILESAFKNLWADNGDECSKQYAGTGALKADFTRLGRRTYVGAMNDGVNAITRYFRNNFADGYRQDAIDLFLGDFVVQPSDLPPTLETTLLSFDQNGLALLAASFAVAMMILCMLVAESSTATLFWLVVFLYCLAFIFYNGEEFVNRPKLKKD